MAVDRIALVQPQVGSQGFKRTMKAFGGTFAISAVDVTTINNTIQLFDIPDGFVPLGLSAIATDMDTGSPALTLSLGYTGSTAAFLSASTIGQAGTTTQTLVAAASGVKLSGVTRVQLLVAAAAATPAAGTLIVWLWGAMDN